MSNSKQIFVFDTLRQKVQQGPFSAFAKKKMIGYLDNAEEELKDDVW